MKYLQENLMNIIGILIGVISIFLAIFFFLKSRKIRIPLYSIASYNLLRKEIKGLENVDIKFKNEAVDNLTVSKIAFWNGGRLVIDRNDLPEGYQLKIHPNEGIRIFNAEILYVDEDSNQIKLRFNEKQSEVIIDFEYLDFKQGAVINVLHSGNSSDGVKITGVVKGAGKFKYSDLNEEGYSFLIALLIVMIAQIGSSSEKNPSYFWLALMIIPVAVFLIRRHLKLKSFPTAIKKIMDN